MTERIPAFVVSTPFPGAKEVVCYTDTWHGKIIPADRGGGNTFNLTISTLEKPIAVCIGKTNPGYVAFVGSDLSAGNLNPFTVIVDPNGQPMPALASVGYRRDFKSLTEHTILWTPPIDWSVA